MHIVTDSNYENVKSQVKENLRKLDIDHSTIELESTDITCIEEVCHTE